MAGFTEQQMFDKMGIGALPATPENPISPATPPPAEIIPPVTPAAIPVAAIPLATPEAIPPATPDIPATPPAEENIEIKFGGSTTDTPPASAPVTPTFDAKAIFGLDITPDEASNRVKNWDTITAKVAELESRKPYANQYIEDLNKAVSSGVSRENFDKVYSSDPDKMTPLDKVITQLQWESGISETDAKLIVEDKYHLGVEETETMSDIEKQGVQRTKQLGNALLNADAQKADKFLRDHKQQALTPPAQQQQITQEAIEKTWSPVIPQITKNYEVLQIGTDIQIKTESAELNEIQNVVLQTLKDQKSNLDPTSERGRAIVNSLTEEVWKVRNFDRTIREIRRHDKAVAAKALLEYKNGLPPGTGGADTPKAPPSTEPTMAQSMKAAHDAGY